MSTILDSIIILHTQFFIWPLTSLPKLYWLCNTLLDDFNHFILYINVHQVTIVIVIVIIGSAVVNRCSIGMILSKYHIPSRSKYTISKALRGNILWTVHMTLAKFTSGK